MHATDSIWAMRPEAADACVRQAALRPAPSAARLAVQEKAAAKALRKTSNGKVAVVPIRGYVDQRYGSYGYGYGGFSCEWGQQAIGQLLADRGVEAIVLDVDSPGGGAFGVEELGDVIHAGTKVKPIHAIANSECCSAAYWLASQATTLSATPGAMIGSIGVFVLHVDVSQALDADGVKVTLVKAGKYKAEGHPSQPLADETRDWLQECVDRLYGRFLKAVARGRGTSVNAVRTRYGEGRCLDAQQALAAGLVDGIRTLPQLLEKLGAAGSASLARAAGPAEVLRLRQAHRRRVGVDTAQPAVARSPATIPLHA